MEEYAAHYFGDADAPMGDHTRMIRQAYQTVQQKQRKQWVVVAAGVVFEPTAGGFKRHPALDFQSSAISHSATPP